MLPKNSKLYLGKPMNEDDNQCKSTIKEISNDGDKQALQKKKFNDGLSIMKMSVTMNNSSHMKLYRQNKDHNKVKTAERYCC